MKVATLFNRTSIAFFLPLSRPLAAELFLAKEISMGVDRIWARPLSTRLVECGKMILIAAAE